VEIVILDPFYTSNHEGENLPNEAK